MSQSNVVIAGEVPAFLAHAVSPDPGPLLTFYDDATGERTELSAVTLGNWVAKTANLLVDGCGLAAGDRAAIALPPHWQTAAVLLGTWSAGVMVHLREESTLPETLPAAAPETLPAAAPDALPAAAPETLPAAAPDALPAAGTGPSDPAFDVAFDAAFDVAFVASDRLAGAPAADQQFVLGLAPMAAPLPVVPAGFLDYAAEVRAHGDTFRSFTPIHGSDPASVDGTTYQQWDTAAAETAATLEIHAGDRVLIDVARHGHPLRWLLAPLAVGASVVLCANLDPAAVADRVAAERVTRVVE